MFWWNWFFWLTPHCKKNRRIINSIEGFIHFINPFSNFPKHFFNTSQFHKPLRVYYTLHFHKPLHGHKDNKLFEGLLFFIINLWRIYYLCNRARIYEVNKPFCRVYYSKGFFYTAEGDQGCIFWEKQTSTKQLRTHISRFRFYYWFQICR